MKHAGWFTPLLGMLALIVILAVQTTALAGEPAPATGATLYLPLTGKNMRGPLLPPTPVVPVLHVGQPLARFTTADFTGPANCEGCHSGLSDHSGANVTPSDHWRATMMANAAKDPYWQAKVESEIAHRPEMAGAIESTCTRCHMPMAHVQAQTLGEPTLLFGQGFLNPTHPLHQAAMDGVSCTLCHQIQPDGLGTPATGNGGFVIDASTQPPERVLFGPFPDPDMMNTMIMRSGSGYTAKQGLHMTEALICAPCHTLHTPATDSAGQPALFPEQMTYGEWEHSQYADGGLQGRTCQACHMPLAQGSVALFPGAPERSPFFQHTFVGSNTLMLGILQAHVAELQLTASTAAFANAIHLTLANMQQHSATLAIPAIQVVNGVLAADVQVSNLTGHKLPTAYPTHRAWLHVRVSDADGRLIFESGRPLPHGGIQGNDADLDLHAFEPHYTEITRGDQVQIYEAIMGDAHSVATYTLLDAYAYLKDNRLLPAGFDKTTADPDMAVIGAVTDADFLGGGDVIRYQIAVEGYTAPYTFAVELLFQSVSYPAVLSLRQIDAPLVNRFGRYWDETDKTPVRLAAAQATP